MNSETGGPRVSVELLGATDAARRALFAAANRVLRYHQAALDARFNRLVRAEAQLRARVGPNVAAATDTAA